MNESGSEEEMTAPKVTSGRRGRRGRGNMTRSYSDHNVAKGEKSDVGSQDFLPKDSCKSRGPAQPAENELISSASINTSDDLDVEELKTMAGRNAAIIIEATKKSGNLKGELVKQLKEAATSLTNVVAILAGRTEASENKRLSLENTRLKRELECLKDEIKAYRREFHEMRTETAAARASTHNSFVDPIAPPAIMSAIDSTEIEELKRSIIMSVGCMINARLAGLEDRLLPAKTVRPPLAADKRPQTSIEAQTASHPSTAANVFPRRELTTIAPQMSGYDFPPIPAYSEMASGIGPVNDGWVTIARKGKKGKKDCVTVSNTDNPSAAKVSVPVGRKKVNLEVPRTAAVILTLQSGAEAQGLTYRQVIEKAEECINLKELGIEGGLNCRKTATGARILELSGPQGDEKADKLAKALESVLFGIAYVARPVKRADVRLTELSDSATRERVEATVASFGGCPQDQVRVTEVRSGPGGMGTAFVSCPVTVAKKLVEAGKIGIGWTTAKVVEVEQRPMRCFKCMGLGHTRPTCPSPANRGDMCFRCGKEGHRSKECDVTPFCMVCSSAGLNTNHIMGGKNCRPPVIKGKDPSAQIVRPLNGESTENTEEAAMTC